MNRILSLSEAVFLALFASAAFAADVDTPSAVPEPQFLFDQVDINSDGAISREEAASAGLNIDWGIADADNSGSLSRDEYEQAVRGGDLGGGDVDTDIDGAGDESGVGGEMNGGSTP